MSASRASGVRSGTAVAGTLLLTGVAVATLRQPSHDPLAIARAVVWLLAFQPCILLAAHDPRAGIVAVMVAGWSLLVAIWVWLLLHDPAVLGGVIGVVGVALCGWYHQAVCRRLGREQALEAERWEREQRTQALALDEIEGRHRVFEEKLRRYQALEGVAEQLATSLDRRRVARTTVEHAAEIIGKARRTALFLVDEAAHHLALVAWCGEAADGGYAAKQGDIFDEFVLKERKPLHVADLRKDFRFTAEQVAQVAAVRSLIGAPLVSRSRVVGVLRMEHPEPEVFDPDDLRVLDILSDLAAMAVDNAMLFERTEELAVRDGLTGLAVRRYFNQRLEEEWHRALRTTSPCALLLIDIDHFKWYNDTYGHIAGDRLLQRLAGTLLDLAEAGEFLARYGGEEFAVIAPLVERRVAVERAEAIRQRVERESFLLRRQETHITVSIGVAFFEPHLSGPEEVIRIADRMLYQAKATGRNHVCVAG